MDPLVTIALPIALVGVAAALARRELRQYRAAGDDGDDLFTYTRGRLIRRMTGVALLVVLAATLAALAVWPASTPAAASLYLGLLVGEVSILLVLPLFDLRETARSARADRLTAPGGRPPRTRSRPRPPR